MISKSPSRWLIDVACALVVAATIAMYLIDQSAAASASSTQTVLALAVGKTTLVCAIFMGLMWKSRTLLTVLTGSFMSLYLILITVLT